MYYVITYLIQVQTLANEQQWIVRHNSSGNLQYYIDEFTL